MARKADSVAEDKPQDVVIVATPKQGARGPKSRKALRLAAWSCLYMVLVVATLVGGTVLWIMDRPLEAPLWVQTRIEAHIAAQAPQTRIRFGAMVLTVQRGWRPMLELRDVRFEDTSGGPLLAVSDLQATLAMRPLLDGLVQPRTVAMSGLYATVRRQADGQVSVVTSAEQESPAAQAATLPALINQVDTLFLRPELAALREVDISSVTLRFEDARARQAWTVDGARLRLEREGNDLTVTGDLALLSGGADVATMAANFTSQLGVAEAQFGVTVTEVAAHDVAAFNPAFGWLEVLRAPISGSLRGGLDASGALAPINATLQIAQGVLQPTGDTPPIPFTSARTYFEYDPGTATLRFDEVSFVSAWGRASAVGMTVLGGLETGRLTDLVGQVRVSDMVVNPPDVFDAPRKLGRASMDFRLIPKPFRLDLGEFRLEDEGSTLRLDGVLSAVPGGWDLALDGRMDSLTPKRLLELWPAQAAANTRKWISENLTAGVLRDVDLAVRSKPGSKPDTYFGFNFEEVVLQYVKGMPPIVEGAGRASIFENRFAMVLEEGEIIAPQAGRITLDGSRFVIPDMTIKKGAPAEVYLQTESTATALLSVLDSPPLNVMANAGLDPALADAHASARATLKLPLRDGITFDDMDLEVDGTLSNVRSTTLVPDRTLVAPELDVTVRSKGPLPGVTIAGAGQFDTIPFDGTWSLVFGETQSTVSADMEISANTVAALSLGLPPGTLRGQGTGTLSLILPRGAPPEFSVTSDLRGLTLASASLGWVKSPDTGGVLEVAGTLGAEPDISSLRLTSPGLEASGRVSISPEGGLREARFSRVRVGGWLDAPVVLTGRGLGVSPAIAVRGGTLDLRGAEFGSGGGSASSGQSTGPLTLALDTLHITDTIALNDMRGDFTLTSGLQGQFVGKVNGAAAVSGQVVPQSGRSAFQIESADAGAVFAAAGFLKQARGGQMKLLLTPVGTAGAFNGALNVSETRVRDAPAIAELFNALSVVGLIEQMGGQGLHFQEVEAAFRLTPDRVTLTQASAVGPSIGLSMDGTYDVNTAQMDMQGVFSPIYLINGIGSLLTRRGEGLIGFNFRLTGPASSPNVSVNPVSALTPSIFREIFRRPPPEVTVEPGEVPGTEPRLLRPEPERPAPRDQGNAGNR